MQHINIISKQHARIGAGLLKTVMLVSGSMALNSIPFENSLREFFGSVFIYSILDLILLLLDHMRMKTVKEIESYYHFS